MNPVTTATTLGSTLLSNLSRIESIAVGRSLASPNVSSVNTPTSHASNACAGTPIWFSLAATMRTEHLSP